MPIYINISEYDNNFYFIIALIDLEHTLGFGVFKYA